MENFAVRVAHANLASKNDIAKFVKKTNFGDKLINVNKKWTLNKTKHVEAEKKINDLTNKVAQISYKGYDFLLGRMYFAGNDGDQKFRAFTPVLTSLILDSNKKVTNWISTEMTSEKIKLFDTNLEPNMSNLAKGKAILKFKNSVLVQKTFSSLYSNFILNL